MCSNQTLCFACTLGYTLVGDVCSENEEGDSGSGLAWWAIMLIVIAAIVLVVAIGTSFAI